LGAPRRHNSIAHKRFNKFPCRFSYLCWNLTKLAGIKSLRDKPKDNPSTISFSEVPCVLPHKSWLAREVAQRIAGHAHSRTTKLYDRLGQKVLVEDMERIHYLNWL